MSAAGAEGGVSTRQVSERGRLCWRGIGFRNVRSIPTAGRALLSRCNATQQRRMHGAAGPFPVLRLGKSLFSYLLARYRIISCPPPRKVSVLLPACTVPDHFLSSASESLCSLTCLHGTGSFPVLLLGKSLFSYLLARYRIIFCPPPRKVSVLLPACTVPDHFLSSSSESLCSLTCLHGTGSFSVLLLGKSLFSYLLARYRIISCPPPRKVSVLLPACTVPDHFLSSSSESLGSLPVFMVPDLFLSYPSGSLGSLPVFMVPDLFLSYPSGSLGSLPVFMVPDLFLSYPSGSLGSLPVFMVPDLFLSSPSRRLLFCRCLLPRSF